MSEFNKTWNRIVDLEAELLAMKAQRDKYASSISEILHVVDGQKVWNGMQYEYSWPIKRIKKICDELQVMKDKP